MSNKTITIKLGNLFKIKHGYGFKGKYFSSSGPYILLTPGNFHDEGGFKIKGDKEKYYKGEFPKQFILNKGDLIIAMTEQMRGLLGSSAIVPTSNIYLHNQRLGLITDLKVSEIDKKYLYYLFNTKIVRDQIQASATGAKVRHTSPSNIYEVKVTLPSLSKQQKIVSVLSAYDNLIDNSSRQIKILEDMAQTIYKEWFINFRFPGYEEVKFINSDLGNIPEGWTVSILEEIAERKNEKYVEDLHKDLPLIDLSRIPRKSNYITQFGRYNEITSSRIIFNKNNILFGAIRPYFHKVLISPIDGISNVSVFILTSKDAYCLPYLFNLLFNENTINWSTQNSNGTKMPVISWEVFKKMKIIIPDKMLIKRFFKVVNPILETISTNTIKCHNLRKTRDLIFPKLMTGEVEV